MDELQELLKASFEYAMAEVHTALPGVVVKYDPKTRRADIQPSIKRKLPNGTFLEFPVIPEVPVMFPGSRQYTLHFPLEKDGAVLLIVCERGTDAWRESGGKSVEESDPRRFDIQDCFAIPGLQPVDFIPVEEAGLHIIHKAKPDGEVISHITMNDEQVAVAYKKLSVILKGTKMSVKNEGKSLFTLIDTLVKTIAGMKTVGSPAQHAVSPDDIAQFEKLGIDIAELLED